MSAADGKSKKIETLADSRKGLSIHSKYLIVLLSCTLLSIMVIGYIAWDVSKQSIAKANYEELLGLRNERAHSVQNFFAENSSFLKVLSQTDDIINALQKFESGFQLLKLYEQSLQDNKKEELQLFYEQTFHSQLKENMLTDDLPNVHQFLKTNPTSSYLQYHYIVNNEHPLGKKHLLTQANDNSYYSDVHKKYHNKIASITKELQFDDLYLIDRSGNIVYSVAKNIEFATNILKGPHHVSSLGYTIREIMQETKKGSILIQDFDKYIPVYNQASAFISIPIYSKTEYLGILSIQLSIEKINAIMTNNKQWKEDGLGDSGEIYLLANDLSMRSNSRILLEDPNTYTQLLNAMGEKQKTLDNIKLSQSSVLNKTIKNQAVDAALNGESGYKIINGYYGDEVLSTYMPLHIKGLNWIILAEKKLSEINQPVANLQRIMMTTTIILIIFVSIIALLYSSLLLKPIDKMITASRAVLDRKLFHPIKVKNHDELGILASSLNQLIKYSEDTHQQLDKEKEKNHDLLLNFLPNDIVYKIEKGETHIAQKYDNVAILFTSLSGLNELINEGSADDTLVKLTKLFNSFDTLTEQHEVDRLNLLSENYIVTCGLHKPRMDYARRCVHFALELFDLVQNFNHEEGVNLNLRIGIHSGSVIAGIIGKKHFVYSLWGDNVSIANRIHYEAQANALRITQNIYNQLSVKENFQRCKLLKLDNIGDLATWEYTYHPIKNNVNNEVSSHV